MSECGSKSAGDSKNSLCKQKLFVVVRGTLIFLGLQGISLDSSLDFSSIGRLCLSVVKIDTGLLLFLKRLSEGEENSSIFIASS